MDSDYDNNFFSNLKDDQTYDLFRGNSIDNFVYDRNGNFLTNRDEDYAPEDFMMDKSDTKSNSKLPSHFKDIDVNSKLIFNSDYFTQNEKDVSTKEKVFNVTKDRSVTSENLNVSNIANCHMSISERMKIKIEKAKLLLGGKKKRESENENEIESLSNGRSTDSRDYVIDNDKLIPLTDRLDKFTKKEIKIIRNRISAQKSRDKQKQEFDKFKQLSHDLTAENKLLKDKLAKSENELQLLRRKTRNCSNCYDANAENMSNRQTNLLTTSVVDMSNTSRSNFSLGSKFGVLSGLFLICFILGCLVLSPFKSSEGQHGRILKAELTNQLNNTNSFNNGLVPYPKQPNTENMPINKPIINDKADYPIVLRDTNKESLDESLLSQKRYEFMINMANKIRVANSINGIFQNPRNYNFRDAKGNSNKYSLPKCLDNIEVSSKILDESLSKSLVTTDYFNNPQSIPHEDMKTINQLQNNVESLLCKDFVSTTRDKNHNFDEIINKKINDPNTKDCLYLHMVIPAKENRTENKINIDFSDEGKSDTLSPSPRTYYEIGCKIFEINKIYK